MAKAEKNPPKHYLKFKKRYPALFAAWDAIGRSMRDNGPIDVKTGHLIQLASAAAVRSEGAVHSHVRRALAAGATREEIHHAIMLTAATIGFPTVMAALSWAEDVLKGD